MELFITLFIVVNFATQSAEVQTDNKNADSHSVLYSYRFANHIS